MGAVCVLATKLPGCCPLSTHKWTQTLTPHYLFSLQVEPPAACRTCCRIVDVPDDLSWALFAYSGAASAAGQSYTGAVLCTADGQWPAASQEDRVNAALR